jgi:glycosyltransferase involved in cell wall biosynthesis
VPNVSLIDEVEPETAVNKTRPAVIYAGGLTNIRGIKEIIEAMGLLDGIAELWLLGWWEDTGYERECMSLSGWKYVTYFGARSLEQTYLFMKQADIGIINFFAIPNSIESLPNKAFEYLTCGLPVVMSEFSYWKDNFGKCAVFVNPMDSRSIADKIKNLIEDREKRMKLILEGRRLIENEYSWESESKKLTELYKGLTE